MLRILCRAPSWSVPVYRPADDYRRENELHHPDGGDISPPLLIDAAQNHVDGHFHFRLRIERAEARSLSGDLIISIKQFWEERIAS